MHGDQIFQKKITLLKERNNNAQASSMHSLSILVENAVARCLQKKKTLQNTLCKILNKLFTIVKYWEHNVALQCFCWDMDVYEAMIDTNSRRCAHSGW